MAFTTIYVAPGVSERDYRRASRVRGRGAASRRGVIELLAAAGFAGIRERDVTAAFARTTHAYLHTSATYDRQLREEWGTQAFEESQRDRRATLALIEEGVLRRGLSTARRPPERRWPRSRRATGP